MTAMSLSRARWVVALATALGVATTTSLGVWQLGRADLKDRLAAQREARAALPPLGWSAFGDLGRDAAGATEFDRPVVLRGRWLHEATVFLNNRPMAGRTGFIVVTPLVSVDGQQAVAVQRGWVPRRLDDRMAVPALPQEADEVEVRGVLAPPPSKLYELGPDDSGRIRQNIDLSTYAAQWSLRLPPVSVQQWDPGSTADGLVREWPRLGADVHKHYGYATQWFGLSAVMVFLYVWFQFIAPRRRNAP